MHILSDNPQHHTYFNFLIRNNMYMEAIDFVKSNDIPYVLYNYEKTIDEDDLKKFINKIVDYPTFPTFGSKKQPNTAEEIAKTKKMYESVKDIVNQYDVKIITAKALT